MKNLHIFIFFALFASESYCGSIDKYQLSLHQSDYDKSFTLGFYSLEGENMFLFMNVESSENDYQSIDKLYSEITRFFENNTSICRLAEKLNAQRLSSLSEIYGLIFYEYKNDTYCIKAIIEDKNHAAQSYQNSLNDNTVLTFSETMRNAPFQQLVLAFKAPNDYTINLKDIDGNKIIFDNKPEAVKNLDTIIASGGEIEFAITIDDTTYRYLYWINDEGNIWKTKRSSSASEFIDTIFSAIIYLDTSCLMHAPHCDDRKNQ